MSSFCSGFHARASFCCFARASSRHRFRDYLSQSLVSRSEHQAGHGANSVKDGQNFRYLLENPFILHNESSFVTSPLDAKHSVRHTRSLTGLILLPKLTVKQAEWPVNRPFNDWHSALERIRIRYSGSGCCGCSLEFGAYSILSPALTDLIWLPAS